jgi:hypothetical protein
MTDYERIYGGCQDSVLWRTMMTMTEQAWEYAEQAEHDSFSYEKDHVAAPSKK